MDQIKIGNFIAEKRKAVSLTQSALAEKLGITDRAVSKWERGICLPDAAIMLELCGILKITVNELLTGEMINERETQQKNDQIIKDLLEQKQQADKHLLNLEIVVGIIGVLVLLGGTILAAYINASEIVRVVIILISLLPLLIATPFMLKVEQKAGYYECKNCGHKYIPDYKSVFMAMHMGRTRYLRCPKCNEKTWSKKVIK